MHPYLLASPNGRVDDWELTVPAATMLHVDERGLPTGNSPVEGTDVDFRNGRRIGDTVLDTPMTDLDREADGLARVRLRDQVSGHGVLLWMDVSYRWLQIFTGDTLPADVRRTSLAVEPMTCPPDALRTGTDLVVLEPGDVHEASWGLALDEG
jgi:aldose 1-epimerase